MGHGIDYGMGTTNRDTKTDIRYGVIHQHSVLQSWADSSESDYGNPESGYLECSNGHTLQWAGEKKWGDSVYCRKCREHCDLELPDCAEPIAHVLDDGKYQATQGGDDCDIFILKSPYYTRAAFCSPCAPGARSAQENLMCTGKSEYVRGCVCETCGNVLP